MPQEGCSTRPAAAFCTRAPDRSVGCALQIAGLRRGLPCGSRFRAAPVGGIPAGRGRGSRWTRRSCAGTWSATFRARARASGTPPLRHVDAREFLDETPYPETRWSSRREVDNRGGPGRSGTSAPASGRSPRAGQATPFAGRAAHYTVHERVRIEVRPGQRRGAAPAPAGKWWVPATRASARGVARTADRRTDQRGSPVRPRHGNLPGGAARGRVAAAGGHSGPWSFRASVVVSASFGFLLLQATGRADRHLPSPSVNVHQLFWGSERRRAKGRAIAHGKPSGCNAIR